MKVTEADLWRKLRSDFKRLVAEEYAAVPDPSDTRRLRAYSSRAGEGMNWTLSDGPSADFRYRFEETAARSGSALGSLPGVQPRDFWLQHLFVNLIELDAIRNDRGHLAVGGLDQGGIIREVCQASVEYCCRLIKEATDRELAALASSRSTGAHKIAKVPIPFGTNWADITIRVTSETRVQILVGEVRETRTFEEMGFGDGRSSAKVPRRAWTTLLELARNDGYYEIHKFKDAVSSSTAKAVRRPVGEAEQRERMASRALAMGKKRSAEEKRMEEIRQCLRTLFGLEGDPLSFVIDGTLFGYQAKFRIHCAESYHQ